MAGYASPPQFEEATDHWPAYLVRLEAFFEGNGITEEKKKRALLVAGLSTHTVAVVSGRCAPTKPVPAMAAACIQRWALQLSTYSYIVKFKDGKANVPADALSRLPRAAHSREVSGDEDGAGKTPAMLLIGRELRSRLDNLLPSEKERDSYPFANDFLQKDEPIWVRNYGCLGDPWTQAWVQTTEGSCMVTAEGPEGELMRRHLDQVKPRVVVQDSEQVQPRLSAEGDRAIDKTASADTTDGTTTLGLRRSTRSRRPPDTFSP
ncbi:uncharacterized protein LOC125943318 [Dermacentor silvarum]|uniref:uncharacterized protein LOC125943318 n=1 Tax=Dermacentor silvarum TaxID=543639 RepID=UPI002100F8E4|nr:uncharacterized protein LOC125943318 [Dermacentor silvarum]